MKSSISIQLTIKNSLTEMRQLRYRKLWERRIKKGDADMLLEHVQIIKERNQPKFAVIDFEEYSRIKELLQNEEKLHDYLDFLHIQRVKSQSTQTFTLDEVKEELFG